MHFMLILSSLVISLLVKCEAKAPVVPDEKWGYVTVRPKAHMFWWLYGALDKGQRDSLPLILWLQGGPGASGAGFGNFMEIGPHDIYGNPRNATWLTKANVLFIDNPVGAGFSYVDETSALTTNVAQIADDLFVVLSAVFKEVPLFKGTKFYIFCESYGGKMTAAFGMRLHRGIVGKEIDCNFQGVALGDSWISPVDSVMTWGPYLYQFNLLDDKDLAAVMNISERTAKAAQMGQWVESTKLWDQTEMRIAELTDNVDVYNVLLHPEPPFPQQKRTKLRGHIARLHQRHVARYEGESLKDFMNTKVRAHLKGAIPDHVEWGGQSGAVFEAQSGDFMKPVIDAVSELLNANYHVSVFQGQLDMICDTPGAERWIKKLSWEGLPDFLPIRRYPMYVKSKGINTQGFVKEYANFALYYILNAGHMVPADNPEMALKMVGLIVGV